MHIYLLLKSFASIGIKVTEYGLLNIILPLGTEMENTDHKDYPAKEKYSLHITYQKSGLVVLPLFLVLQSMQFSGADVYPIVFPIMSVIGDIINTEFGR